MRFDASLRPAARLLTALSLLFAFPIASADRAVAGSPAGDFPVASDAYADAVSAEEVRTLLLETFDEYESILLRMRGGEHLVDRVHAAQEAVHGMSAEQLVGMQAAGGEQLLLLHDSVTQLRATLFAPLSVADERTGQAKSGGFPVTTFIPMDMILGFAVSGSQEVECDDGLDDDADGRTDCDDPDCNEDPDCDDHVPAPLDTDQAGTELWYCSLATPPSAQQLTLAMNGAAVADLIAIVVKSFCELVIAGFNCPPCCIATDVYALVAHWIYDSMSLCSGFLGAAQDTATYLRSGHIHDDLDTLDATSIRIEGDVAAVQATANIIDSKVDAIQETADTILDIVTCKVVPTLRVGSGCDGLDSDCDGTIDNCSEDVFAPVLHVDQAVTQPWYGSVAEAVEAVESATLAVDSCQAVSVSTSPTGTCGAVDVLVTATDACGHETSLVVPVRVDGVAPVVAIPDTLEGTCFSSVAAAEASVLAATTLSDDCTPVADLSVRAESTVSECSLLVRVQATDESGKSAEDTVTVRVDPKPPLLHLDSAVSQLWYPSPAEATEAVARAVQVSDDCGSVSVSAPVLSGTCGAVTASVTATDACGNETAATTLVRIDGTPPVVVLPASLDGSCHATVEGAEAAVLAAATIDDDCTPAGQLDVRVDSTVTECALRVRVEAIDQAGHRTVAATTVRVDAGLPTVEIQRLLIGFRGEVLGFQTPPCFESVDAAEQAVLAASRFSDGCSAAGELAVAVSSSGAPCSLEVTVSAADGCGSTASDSVTVRVDPEPPTVSCNVAEDRLWPANHEMVDVGFSFDAFDGCTGEPELRVRVTSDERTASADGAGQSSPSPDAEILHGLDGEILGIRLRAERSSSGNGRVYQIHVEATDACGHFARSSCTVAVPKNGGHSPVVDDGQFHDATAVN